MIFLMRCSSVIEMPYAFATPLVGCFLLVVSVLYCYVLCKLFGYK